MTSRIKTLLILCGITCALGLLVTGLGAVSAVLWPYPAFSALIVAAGAAVMGLSVFCFLEARSCFDTSVYFISRIVHDISNPLTGVLMSVSMLKTMTGDNQSLRQLADIADNGARYQQKLMEIIASVLRFEADAHYPKPEPTDLREMAESLSDEIKGYHMNKDIKVSVTGHGFEDDKLTASCDPLLMRLLLTSFLLNSYKYTVAGGNIAVVFSRRDGMLRLKVSDDGQLPSSPTDKFFACAVAKSDARPGVCMSLYLCGIIARMLKGTLSAGVKNRTFHMSVEFKESL